MRAGWGGLEHEPALGVLRSGPWGLLAPKHLARFSSPSQKLVTGSSAVLLALEAPGDSLTPGRVASRLHPAAAQLSGSTANPGRSHLSCPGAGPAGLWEPKSGATSLSCP